MALNTRCGYMVGFKLGFDKSALVVAFAERACFFCSPQIVVVAVVVVLSVSQHFYEECRSFFVAGLVGVISPAVCSLLVIICHFILDSGVVSHNRVPWVPFSCRNDNNAIFLLFCGDAYE